MVGSYNIERGRNIPLSLRNRGAAEAVDSGNTFRTVFKTTKGRKGLQTQSEDSQAGGRTQLRIPELLGDVWSLRVNAAQHVECCV